MNALLVHIYLDLEVLKTYYIGKSSIETTLLCYGYHSLGYGCRPSIIKMIITT